MGKKVAVGIPNNDAFYFFSHMFQKRMQPKKNRKRNNIIKYSNHFGGGKIERPLNYVHVMSERPISAGMK